MTRLELIKQGGRHPSPPCALPQVGEGPVSGYFGAVVKHAQVGVELEVPTFPAWVRAGWEVREMRNIHESCP